MGLPFLFFGSRGTRAPNGVPAGPGLAAMLGGRVGPLPTSFLSYAAGNEDGEWRTVVGPNGLSPNAASGTGPLSVDNPDYVPYALADSNVVTAGSAAQRLALLRQGSRVAFLAGWRGARLLTLDTCLFCPSAAAAQETEGLAIQARESSSVAEWTTLELLKWAIRPAAAAEGASIDLVGGGSYEVVEAGGWRRTATLLPHWPSGELRLERVLETDAAAGGARSVPSAQMDICIARLELK